MSQDDTKVNNKVNDQAVHSSEKIVRVFSDTNEAVKKQVIRKAVHSSENIKDENRSNDTETHFIANIFEDFETAYKASEAHLDKLLKDKILSKRNLKNIVLLMQYYFNHMNAVTSDGKPWRVYDSHILSSLNKLGFGSYALKAALRNLRIAGYMSVQSFMTTVMREALFGREKRCTAPHPRRFFSITPVFNDFDEDPGKRVLLPGSHAVFIISPIKRKLSK